VVLLENLLPRIRDGAPLAIVYPEDGAVLVPSPIAILRSANNPELARRVYDFFFTEAAQEAIVRGFMYSPLPDHPPPEGAPPFSELVLRPWSHEFLLWVKGRRDEIQARFRSILRG
jgi:iron(III) transport system substrate-binding protein